MSATASRPSAEMGTVLADQAVALGLPVFPCNGHKRPVTENGFYDAARDPAAIRRMFANPAAALIGVPPGPASGFVAVDVDSPPSPVASPP